jgi:2-polyprenyl-3-methyl-5-hydroxy-6-metoxy-1,4-benzoquinol methylase
VPDEPRCEVCGAATEPWPLRGGGVLTRCPACRHVLRDLGLCPAAARDAAYGGDPGLDRIRLGLTFRRLRRLVPPGGPVFEIGYGAGTLLRRFAAAGHPVAGVDADQLGVPVDPLLAAAGTLHRGELETLPPTEARYDLVYGVHVLEHLRDPAAALQRAFDLLRPGGRICLVTPTTESLGPAWFGAAWWLLEDPTHVRFFSPESARRLLAAAGFDHVAVRRLRLDTLSMEAASLRRRRRLGSGPAGRTGPAGVLAERGTLALAAGTAPAVLAARAALPRLAPSIEITAKRPRPGPPSDDG